MSKAEIMGRLIYHGFQIVQIRETNKETFFVTQPHPSCIPSLSEPLPNEGFIFSMKRLGINKKPITVYKLRSMHPYAEYAQDYLHKTNGLDTGGKFKNDYRVSTGGRFIRKYWIDELPMLYNLLKGDIKLIGVRPISEHYFNLYPESLQTIRSKHKPGLLPPYYADLPKNLDEIVESELKYLKAYETEPFKTDLDYLGKIFKNIFVHKARSQ
ncbi:sugar transferase [Larkinella bovis]|uniref:Sugar transferase n=1 Tax=Larkinella bovis TaxID=683041 RepID=A0ABW0II31_9BACT